MHQWEVTVQLTYTVNIWTREKDHLDAQECAIDVEDPDYDPPSIVECNYLGEGNPDASH